MNLYNHSRRNHIILLITKIIFIILCFGVTFAFFGLQESNYNLVNIQLKEEDVITSVHAQTSLEKNLDVGFKNNKVEITIPELETREDVYIYVLIPTSEDLDLSLLAKTLNMNQQDKEEYLQKYNQGPWNCKLSCSFDSSYSFNYVINCCGEKSTIKSSSSYVSDEFCLYKGDIVIVNIIIKAADNEEIKAGKYYLTPKIGITKLLDESTTLETDNIDLGATILQVTKSTFSSFGNPQSYKNLGNGYFWLTFAGMLFGFGAFFYLYKDISNSFKIAKIVNEYCFDAGAKAMMYTFVNGVCVKTEETTVGGSTGLIQSILAFVLSYWFFYMLLPVRFIIYFVKDIQYIVTEKEDENNTLKYIISNIVGSAGIYGLSFGFVLSKLQPMLGIIVLGVGLVMLIIAIVLTKDKNKEKAK